MFNFLLAAGLFISPTERQVSAAAVIVACDADAVAECVRDLNPFGKEDACQVCMPKAQNGCSYEYTGGGGSGSSQCERTFISWLYGCPPATEFTYPGGRKAWAPACNNKIGETRFDVILNSLVN